MHVFVTGSTGWVGSAVVEELLAAGHKVTGLSRSREKAQTLAAAGMQILHATLDDLDVLRGAAADADAVVHTAFNHDFSKFAESAEQDRRVIEALGKALKGLSRPLLVTSGLLGITDHYPALESDVPASPSLRKSEAAARALASGCRSSRVTNLTLDGLSTLSERTCRHTASARGICSDGRRPVPICSPTSTSRLTLPVERGLPLSSAHDPNASADQGAVEKGTRAIRSSAGTSRRTPDRMPFPRV